MSSDDDIPLTHFLPGGGRSAERARRQTSRRRSMDGGSPVPSWVLGDAQPRDSSPSGMVPAGRPGPLSDSTPLSGRRHRPSVAGKVTSPGTASVSPAVGAAPAATSPAATPVRRSRARARNHALVLSPAESDSARLTHAVVDADDSEDDTTEAGASVEDGVSEPPSQVMETVPDAKPSHRASLVGLLFGVGAGLVCPVGLWGCGGVR